MLELEEIHGFEHPSEFAKFSAFLEHQLKAENLAEVSVDDSYNHGEIFGGKWFKEPKSGAVWRLVVPDFPFRGLWERMRFS